jgi:cytochrome b
MAVAIASETTDAGGQRPPATIKVWDQFVRIFHWSLVALFAVAFLTGDEIERLHLWAGYTVAILVSMRIVWGVVGSENARFSSFVRGPRAVLTFLKQSLHLEAPRYLGHNPAGGAMIVIMLVLLAALFATGFAMTTDVYWGSETLENVHEALAYIMLVLVGLHVAGVIIASIEHGENLAKAMLTGRKRP